MNHKLVVGLIVLFCNVLQTSVAGEISLDAQRRVFLQSEKLLNSKLSNFPAQAQSLKRYPLYPLLRYQWLRKHLHNSAGVQKFLSEYGYSRYAGLLKREWLNHLAATKQWQTYIRNYEKTDNAALECQYYWAKYNIGDKAEALTAAQKLWTVGYSQPKVCDSLLTALTQSSFFSRKMAWKRFSEALNNGKVNLANYVKRFLPTKDQETADFWLKVHNNPSLVLDHRQWQRNYRQLGDVFAHGIDRLAGSNLDQAVALWDARKDHFQIEPSINEHIERRLGLALAFGKNAAAYERLSRVQNADAAVREWRVRAALLQGDWQQVDHALAELTDLESRQARWQYWQAQALAKTGRKSQSHEAFIKLAEDRSLFGFIASEIVDKQPQLDDRPIAFTPAEMAQFKQLPAVSMVSEFNALGRINEARRQWWFLLSQLDKQQILMAAKLAQQWGWTQTAIFTVAKAEHWDDVGLRFPIDYEYAVKKYARQQALDPAVVFGLIRRESVFDRFARSPAGARGLMQIMPQTGQQIARKLKEKWHSVSSLFDPAVNVKYGTYYYKQMLDRFNGHFALAAAAYNAGPGRVNRWLPKHAPMSADIWIETIPFKETREYVAAVLGYAIIYQQRMKRNAIKVSDLMRDILPAEK